MGMIGNAPVAGTIGTGNIQDGGVETADIKDGAVTTAKIADLGVTNAKMAAGAAIANIGYTPLNKAGDTPTGAINLYGVARNNDGLRVGASNASTAYGFRIGASGATDPLEIWREHSNGDVMVASFDYNGRVSLPLQPVFSAKFSGSSTQTGNLQPIKYDTIYSNVGSFYSASTGIFTAQVAGTYLAIVQSLNNNIPGYYAMGLVMAGGTVANSWSSSEASNASVQSMVILQAAKYLNVGDTAYVNMVQNKASNYMAETYNVFTVIKVA